MAKRGTRRATAVAPAREHKEAELPAGTRRRALLLAFPAFLAIALALYSPCFSGPFISDDAFAVLNPYVTPLSAARVVDVFLPNGAATTMQYEYRPMWFLLHGIERQAFGDTAYPAYHLVNVVLHSLIGTLLVLLLAQSGLPAVWALLGGALFLVHPANVEAVAWISQLTSGASLGLALGAFLLRQRWPAAALICFTLAVLTKPLAAFAFPVAVLFTWMDGGGAARRTTRWAWIGGWAVSLAVFVAIDAVAARDKQYGVPPIHPDSIVVARTIVADFLRYLVMAASGYGLSAFQQARPALSWLDPWWLGGAVAFVLIGWRAIRALGRRRPEGVYWTWALVSFALVSQVIPLIYPMADRYLYFMLPGLLGGSLLWLSALVQGWPHDRRTLAQRAGSGIALALLVAFAVQAHQRAALWVSYDQLAQDSMRHYPDGLAAHLFRSRQAAQRGDAEAAATELRGAFELGNRQFGPITADPLYQPVLRHPAFQKLLIDMADWWIARVNVVDNPNQIQLYQLASAYWLRGDFGQAQRTLERALAVGGPLTDRAHADLARLRASASPR
jgi:hypothetical protein